MPFQIYGPNRWVSSDRISNKISNKKKACNYQRKQKKITKNELMNVVATDFPIYSTVLAKNNELRATINQNL